MALIITWPFFYSTKNENSQVNKGQPKRFKLHLKNFMIKRVIWYNGIKKIHNELF